MSESWFLIDRDADEDRVRGPFDTSEAAAAVRTELERYHPYYAEQGNLWVISEPRQ